MWKSQGVWILPEGIHISPPPQTLPARSPSPKDVLPCGLKSLRTANAMLMAIMGQVLSLAEHANPRDAGNLNMQDRNQSLSPSDLLRATRETIKTNCMGRKPSGLHIHWKNWHKNRICICNDSPNPYTTLTPTEWISYIQSTSPNNYGPTSTRQRYNYGKTRCPTWPYALGPAEPATSLESSVLHCAAREPLAAPGGLKGGPWCVADNT